MSNNSNVNAVQGLQAGGRPPHTRDSTMQSTSIEVPPGVDLIQWVIHYAYSRETCITILDAHGFISHATFSDQQMFTEHLQIMTFSATYFFSRSAQGRAYFTALLHQANGGTVGGEPQKMITAGPVVLTATLYKNPQIFRVDKVQA